MNTVVMWVLIGLLVLAIIVAILVVLGLRRNKAKQVSFEKKEEIEQKKPSSGDYKAQGGFNFTAGGGEAKQPEKQPELRPDQELKQSAPTPEPTPEPESTPEPEPTPEPEAPKSVPTPAPVAEPEPTEEPPAWLPAARRCSRCLVAG